MKTKLRYIFIISCFIGQLFAQEKIQSSTETLVSAPKKNAQIYGFRFGADISKPLRSVLDKNYFGLELIADYRYNYRYYFAAEVGRERKSTKTDYFDFTTAGQYIKLGVDYNVYDNWYGMQNMIYFGGRYAFGAFSQEVTGYTLHTHHNYWNESITGNTTDLLALYQGRTAHWVEFLLGMKVELYKNIYAGMSVRFGKLFYHSQKEFPNFWIPGFQRVWEGSSYGMSYNYSITYLIPFYKKQSPKKNK